MYAVGRLSSYISQGVYTVSAPFHPFGGAVDIIVVQQQDGSFKSSPWYVKFGKFQGVLKTKEKVVSINVNGVETDFHMYLDHTGEAYFLKEVDIEECESGVFDPSSSGEETDHQSLNKNNEKAKGQDFDVKQLSLNTQIDGSNGKIITRTNSRRSRMFGLFGRKSMKEDSRQREAVEDPVKRATSLEHAEIAADLLEVKWSTRLTTNGSIMDEVSTLSSINVAPKEVVMNLHVNEGTLVDSILVPDRINNSYDNSSLQKATAPCDTEMGKHCGSKLVDRGQSNGINSPKASCTSSENLDKEMSNLEASNSEEKFEVMPEISISKFDGDLSIQHNAEHESDGNVQFLSSGLPSGESGTFHIFSETSESSRVGFEASDEQNQISGNSSNGESEKPLVHDKVTIDKVEAGPQQAVLMVKEDSSNLRPLNDEHSCNSSCTKAICGSEGSSFGGETRSTVTESHCTYDIHLLTSASGGAEMLEIIQQETITEPLTDARTSETISFEVHENESQVMGLSHCTSGVSQEELEDRSSGPHPEVVNGNRMSHSVEEAELQGNCTSGSSQKELEESARSSGSNLDVVSDNRMLPSGEVVELQGNWMSSSSQEKRKEPARSSGSHLEVVSGNQIFHSVEEAKLQDDCTSDGCQEELEELAGSSGPHLKVVSGSRILHSVEKAELQGDCNSGGRQEEIEESARSTGPHLEVVSGNQILHSVEEPELHGDCKSDGRQEELEEPARISGHLEVVSSDQILHSVEEAELHGDCTSGGHQEELEELGRSTGPHLEVVCGNRMLRPVEVAELQGGGRSSGSQEKLEEPARSSGLHLEVVCGNRMLHPVEVAELQGDCMSSGSQEKLEEPGWSSGLHLEVVSDNQILHSVEEAELQGDGRSGGRLEELEESARSSGPHLEVVSGNQMFHSVEEEKLQGDCTSGGRQEELEESARGSGAHPELVRDNQILHSVKEAKIQGDCTFSSNSNTTSLVEEEENLGQENEMNKLHQASAFIDDLQLSSTEHSPTKSTPSCIPLPKISREGQFTFSDTGDFEPGAVHCADSGLSDCVDTENYPLVTIGSSEESLGPNDVNHDSYFSSVNNVQEPSPSSFESPIEESRTTSSPISIPRIRKCGGAEVDWMTKSVPNFRFHDDDLEISGIRHHLSHSLDSHYDTFKLELQKNGASDSLTCDSDTEQPLIEDLTNDDIHAWEELKNMSTDSAVEISLCKHVLYEGMGAEAASLAFDVEKVGLKKFVSLGPGILKNDKLIVRIGGQYLPWDAAAPIILDTLAFGHDQKLAPRGMIPVEQVEKTVNVELTTTTASSSGSWRIWPFTFKRSGTLNSAQPARDHTRDSTSVSTSESISPVKENNTSNVTENSTSNVTEKNTEQKVKFTIKKVKSLVPSSEQLSTLNLKEGQNVITFTFSTAMLGKQQVDAKIYLWKWNTRIVISDVDGTITKSDVLGQFMPLVGKDWSQTGVAHLFSAIKENGYQLLFLSARSISQAYLTRQFLFNLKQDGKALPDGPVVISPDGLFPSLFREVIRRAPHEFKIACLKDIKDLFPPDCNPFYAGFGNRDTDEFSYLKVGIPRGKIFIINAKGEVSVNRRVDRKSYTSLHALVNGMFPAISSAAAEQEEFNSWNYWKMPLPDISSR